MQTDTAVLQIVGTFWWGKSIPDLQDLQFIHFSLSCFPWPLISYALWHL